MTAKLTPLPNADEKAAWARRLDHALRKEGELRWIISEFLALRALCSPVTFDETNEIARKMKKALKNS